MKTSILLLALSVIVTRPAAADIVLAAPGVPTNSRIATKVPFKANYELTQSYRFVFSGIQAKGDTLGAPGSSGTSGNGGQFHLSATVSGPDGSLKVGKLEFRNVQDYNTAPLESLLISPAAIFKATTTPITIGIEWAGQGNAHKPNGKFEVLGEYQKHPPVPIGSLYFEVGEYMLVAAGSKPDGVATIERE